jgi:hypothetical protein
MKMGELLREKAGILPIISGSTWNGNPETAGSLKPLRKEQPLEIAEAKALKGNQ